jgi:hypothetical protein
MFSALSPFPGECEDAQGKLRQFPLLQPPRAWSDMRDKRSAARKSKDLSALLGGSGFTTGNFGVVEYYAKCIFCQIRKTYLCIKNE